MKLSTVKVSEALVRDRNNLMEERNDLLALLREAYREVRKACRLIGLPEGRTADGLGILRLLLTHLDAYLDDKP